MESKEKVVRGREINDITKRKDKKWKDRRGIIREGKGKERNVKAKKWSYCKCRKEKGQLWSIRCLVCHICWKRRKKKKKSNESWVCKSYGGKLGKGSEWLGRERNDSKEDKDERKLKII